jgi:hypothetical protein
MRREEKSSKRKRSAREERSRHGPKLRQTNRGASENSRLPKAGRRRASVILVKVGMANSRADSGLSRVHIFNLLDSKPIALTSTEAMAYTQRGITVRAGWTYNRMNLDFHHAAKVLEYSVCVLQIQI